MANMTFKANLLPDANNTYNLGSSTQQWTIYGSLSGTATNAVKAGQDASGNVITSTYLTINSASATYVHKSGDTITGPIYFGRSGNNCIFGYNSTYPKYGIWYNDTDVDKMRFSASGNADTDAGADLCINGNGNGTVTIRGNTILHAGNYSSWAAKSSEAIKSISRSGTTFTATRCDGTTFTFTQQDNNTTYNFSGTTFYSGNSSNAEHDANNMLYNGTYYYTSNGPSTSLGASTSDGSIYCQAYSTSWVSQIAQDYRNGRLYVRSKNNGTWQAWKSILFSSNGNIAGFRNEAASNRSYYWGFNGGTSETYAVANSNMSVGYATSSGSCNGNAASATTAKAVRTYGSDVQMGTSGSSSNDSGDLVWLYGNGNEKSRIWTDNEYTSGIGPNYRVYNSSGTCLRSSRLWAMGESITGAVWNDYAECRTATSTEPGYVWVEKGDDTLIKSTKRLQSFAGVSSDTWGFSEGETATAKTHIAVAGRVLAYPYRDRNKYKSGQCVCTAPNGTVDIMHWWEIILFPDRIVGTVSCVPEYEIWGGGPDADRDPVKVNGRIWIKVR